MKKIEKQLKKSAKSLPSMQKEIVFSDGIELLKKIHKDIFYKVALAALSIGICFGITVSVGAQVSEKVATFFKNVTKTESTQLEESSASDTSSEIIVEPTLSHEQTTSQTPTPSKIETSSQQETPSHQEASEQQMEETIPMGEGNYYSNIIDSQGKIAYSGGWIFYSNTEENGALYKIKEDGTGKQRIGSDVGCAYINIVGDWIIYKCDITKPFYLYNMVKIKIDGSERSVLTSSSSMSYAYVCDKKLYYKGDDIGFLVIDLETGESEKYNDENYYAPYVLGEWVYFIDSYDYSARYGKLCKKRLGGSEKIKLTDNNARKFIVYDGWVYYTDYNFSIRRVRVDGTEDSEVFSDGYINMLNVSDKMIYAAGRKIFKIELDGSAFTEFNTSIVSDFLFTVTDNYIYYKSDGKVYKISKNGTENQSAQINTP